VPKLSHRASQSSTDFPETLGLSQLAKQHRKKMIPGAKAFAVTFSAMFGNHFVELYAAEKSNQLTE
jgi:hypothetical protein